MYFGNTSQLDDTYDAQLLEQADAESFSLDESGVQYTENGEGYGVLDESAVLEAMIVDQYERMSDAERQANMNDPEFQNLVEAGLVNRKSVVRLSRADDLDRRMAMLSLAMAKEQNSPDFILYKKFRKKEKALLAKIRARFDPRVKRQATVAQRRLVKLNPKAFMLNRPIR